MQFKLGFTDKNAVKLILVIENSSLNIRDDVRVAPEKAKPSQQTTPASAQRYQELIEDPSSFLNVGGTPTPKKVKFKF